MSGCGISGYSTKGGSRRGNGTRGGDGDRISLSQGVTRSPISEDAAFKNFKNNWREFISTSPELALPVVPGTLETAWQPLVTAECVFSPDAKGLVPQVTLAWNESAGAKAPNRRFDLALHHDGFGRNFYSAALETGKLKRFQLPSNSRLVNDNEAVILTGPGLFPKLMDFRTESVQDSGKGPRLRRETLVLRDLSPGLTYTIRMSGLAGNKWVEERRFVFLTPVCPNSF